MSARSRRHIGTPVEQFGGFRSSLLLRIDPADVPIDASVAVADLARQMTTSAPSVQAAHFVDLIENEIATINTRIAHTWLARVDGPIAAHVDLELRIDRLALEAFVRQPTRRDRPLISLSLGAILALDDLVLFALTSKDVLIADRRAAAGDPAARFELPQPLEISGAALERPGRFFEYATALDGGINRPVLTYAMAYTPWRLAQASLVSELALAWVLLHERAHWALGHLDLLREEGATTLCLSETNLESVEPNDRALPLDSELRRTLEAEADIQAFLLLCDYAMRVGGAADRYETMAGTFDVPDDPRVLRRLTFGNCLRVCITAVSLACVAFDQARAGEDDESPTHPRPASRLMNMLINAPIVSPMTKQNEAGRWVLAVEDRTDERGEDNDAFHELAEGIGMGLTDLLVTADNGWAGSPWLRDLMRFWIAEGVDEGPCTTDAGIEVAMLKPIDEALLPRLDRLQRQRFGRLLSLDLSDMWPDRG